MKKIYIICFVFMLTVACIWFLLSHTILPWMLVDMSRPDQVLDSVRAKNFVINVVVRDPGKIEPKQTEVIAEGIGPGSAKFAKHTVYSVRGFYRLKLAIEEERIVVIGVPDSMPAVHRMDIVFGRRVEFRPNPE